MYCMDARIRLSETDRNGKLSMNGLLRLFQDCGYAHAQDRQLGLDYTKKTNCTWYLLSWQIYAVNMPVVGEEVSLRTCIYDRQASLAHKSIAMYNEEGECLAVGDTMWVYVNVITQEPAVPETDVWLPDDFGEKFDMPVMTRRIALPREPESYKMLSDCHIEPYLLDFNGHANNVRLTELAMRLCGADADCRRLRAEFKRQVKGDSIIHPYVARIDKKTDKKDALGVRNTPEGNMGDNVFLCVPKGNVSDNTASCVLCDNENSNNMSDALKSVIVIFEDGTGEKLAVFEFE